MTPTDPQIIKIIDEHIDSKFKEILRSTAFTDRKLTDTPTDNLQVVNKRYVTRNGTVSNRPKSSVASVGQPYFATDTNIPMTYSAAGWRNGVGSIVAQNN